MTKHLQDVFVGRRILVADDSPINRLVALSVLKQLGCVVDAVETGCQAVMATTGSVYDLVLMDCSMPEMDGYEATATIRSLEASQVTDRRLPIVAFTSCTSEEIRRQCFAAGMDDVISKPCRVELLVPALVRWLTPADA